MAPGAVEMIGSGAIAELPIAGKTGASVIPGITGTGTEQVDVTESAAGTVTAPGGPITGAASLSVSVTLSATGVVGGVAPGRSLDSLRSIAATPAVLPSFPATVHITHTLGQLRGLAGVG